MLLKTSVNHVKLPTAIEESHAALGAVVDPVGAVVDLLVSIFCSTCLSSALDTTSPRRPESELSDTLSSSACGQKPEAHIKQTSTHSTIAYGSITYAYQELVVNGGILSYVRIVCEGVKNPHLCCAVLLV